MEEGGGRAGEISGKIKRDSGEERRVRGGSETGGFRPQVAGLLSFSGRPLSLLVEKTLFYPEEHSLLVFSSFLAVVRPSDGLLSASFFIFYFSPLYFFRRPLIVGRMLLSRGTYLECECVFVSQQHQHVCVCVCGYVCVCFISFTS